MADDIFYYKYFSYSFFASFRSLCCDMKRIVDGNGVEWIWGAYLRLCRRNFDHGTIKSQLPILMILVVSAPFLVISFFD
jgi:hypothetical protein